MEELKHCPFCGSKQVEVRHIKDRWSVGCSTTDCICRLWYMRQYNEKEKAVEAWNRRVSDE